MKTLALALASSALALAACSSGNDDAVDNADLNQPVAEDLNQAASDAANAAANAQAEALGDQMNQLNAADAATDNAVNPDDAQEQNVAGM